ncbi:MAG: hypothetical protein KDC11_07965 [Chitinophagaceae bacterium]|nr:hypothetical protein [Chitinophagaceae bacterium]
MTKVFLVFGGGSDTDMAIIYGGCILLILLIVGIAKLGNSIRAFIVRRREKKKAEAMQENIFDPNDLFIGFN